MSTQDQNRLVPAQSFIGFPLLPSELRVKIWEWALYPVPVIAHMDVVDIPDDDPDFYTNHRALLGSPQTSIAASCSEALYETQKLYPSLRSPNPRFEPPPRSARDVTERMSSHDPLMPDHGLPDIYDHHNTIFYLGPSIFTLSFLRWFDWTLSSEVLHIAVDLPDLLVDLHISFVIFLSAMVEAKFPNLAAITILVPLTVARLREEGQVHSNVAHAYRRKSLSEPAPKWWSMDRQGHAGAKDYLKRCRLAREIDQAGFQRILPRGAENGSDEKTSDSDEVVEIDEDWTWEGEKARLVKAVKDMADDAFRDTGRTLVVDVRVTNYAWADSHD